MLLPPVLFNLERCSEGLMRDAESQTDMMPRVYKELEKRCTFASSSD